MTPVMRTPVSPPVHGGINGSSCCTGSGKKPLSPSGQFGEAGSPKADAQAFSGLQSADAAAMPGIAAQAATKAAPSATQMSLEWGKNTVPSRGGGPPFAYQMGSYRNPCGIDGAAPPGQGAAESNPCAAAETRGCDAKPERRSAICAPQVPAHGASAQSIKTDAKGQPVWAMGSQADASWKAPTPGNKGGRVDMAPPGSESSPTKLESPKKAPVGIARPVVGSCAGAGRGPGIAVRVLPQATASGASPLRPLAPKFPPVGPAGTTPRASATTQEVRARVLAPPGLGVAQLRMSSEPDGVPTSRASRNLAEAPVGATDDGDPARSERSAARGGTPAASGGHADLRGSVSSPGTSYGTGVPPIGRPDKGKPDKGTGGGGGGKLTPAQQMAVNSLAVDNLNSMPALDDAAKAQRDKLVDEGKKLASTLGERETLRAQKDKERFRRDQEREERQSRRRDEKRAARQDRNRSRRGYRATQAAKAKRSANKAKKLAGKAQKLAKAAQNKNLSKPARDRLLEKADAALKQAFEATQEHASQSAEADPAGGGIEESVAAEVISAVQEVEKPRAGPNGTDSKEEEEERVRSAAIAPETRIAGPHCSDPCPCNIECPPGTFCVCSRSEPPPGGIPFGDSIVGMALPLTPLLLAGGDNGGGGAAGGEDGESKDDHEHPEPKLAGKESTPEGATATGESLPRGQDGESQKRVDGAREDSAGRKPPHRAVNLEKHLKEQINARYERREKEIWDELEALVKKATGKGYWDLSEPVQLMAIGWFRNEFRENEVRRDAELVLAIATTEAWFKKHGASMIWLDTGKPQKTPQEQTWGHINASGELKAVLKENTGAPFSEASLRKLGDETIKAAATGIMEYLLGPVGAGAGDLILMKSAVDKLTVATIEKEFGVWLVGEIGEHRVQKAAVAE